MAKRNRQEVQDRRKDKKSKKTRKEVQPQKFQEARKAKVIPLHAKNPRQQSALENFTEKQLNVLSGSAGVGKTELAVWWACKRWLEGDIDTIVVTRPAQSLGKDGGAVGGGDAEKLLLYVMPILLKIRKYLGMGTFMNNLQMETSDMLFQEASGICIIPVEKIAGMSFNERTIIIGDEIQSATVPQVKALATRAEEGCQLIICGDVTQSALHGVNGLKYLEDALLANPHELIGVTHFLPEDCQRKGVSAHLTGVFEKEGQW